MIPKLIQQVIKVAKEKKIPVVSDIKYKNVYYYEDSLVIKCNQKEYDAINNGPYSKYWVVTHGSKPTKMITGNQIHEVNTIKNPYFKNANCAGDIFMAGFVNELVNSGLLNCIDTALVKYCIKAGNKLASKSLSKVKDKVV
jgi:sugar/nucleoside kinase (ribokinase family)